MMKKNTQSKVLKSMVVGIAAMMAFETTIPALAAETGEEPVTPTPSTGSESNESADIVAIDAVADVADTSHDAVDSANTATEALENAISETAGNFADVAQAVDAVADAQTAIVDTESAISSLKTDVSTAEGLTIVAEKAETDTTTQATAASSNADKSEQSSASAEQNADNAIDFAKTANTSSSETEARSAAKAATDNLADAVEDLNLANSQVEAAENAYEKAKANLEIAKASDKAAYEAMERAENNLETAKTKAAEASSRVADAAASLAIVQARLDGSEDLENIKNNYDAVLQEYNRVMTNAKAFDNDSKNIHNINSGNYWNKGRELCKSIVEHMILSRDDIDPETANVQFGKNAEGGATTSFTYTDKKGKECTVSEKAETSQGWVTNSLNGHLGYANTDNHVKVTYTDKDGNLHIEYYNYVKDLDDKATGSVYLTKCVYSVNPDATTAKEAVSWSTERLSADPEVYDDITSLTAALAAADELKQNEDLLKTAVSEVGKAQEKVDELKTALTELKLSGGSEIDIEALERAVSKAKDDLDLAKIARDNAAAKVEEAKKAVAAIDLSRFDYTGSDEDSDDASSDDASITYNTVNALPGSAPAATLNALTQTVRQQAGTTASPIIADIADSQIPFAQRLSTPQNADINSVVKNPLNNTKTIGENKVPLSQGPVKEAENVNWFYGLFLAALVAIEETIRRLSKNKNKDNN